MFTNPIRIYGNHSRIAKKYSKQTTDENSEKYKLIDYDGKQTKEMDTIVFDNLLDCFMVAMMLGITHDRKAEEDKDKTLYATVFADIISKKRSTLERIYQHMVLKRYDNLDLNQKVKKAFGIIKDEDKKDDLENLKAYLRGGLEIIDEHFSGCKTLEDFCNQLIEFKNKHNIDEEKPISLLTL